LTRHKEQTYMQEMFEAGASAYVLKQSGFAALLAAVNSVAGKADSVDRQVNDAAANKRSRRHRALPATERERSVLRLAARGETNKEIAAALNISARTVEVHKAAAMRKLGLRDRTDVIRFASMNGWLQDP
jgi:DNA-binding NarL/FixJ family response regulator